MKTMKLGEQIRRVKEDVVYSHLAQGWTYCPRSEWKDKVRTKVEKKSEVVSEETETKKNKGNPKGKAKKNKE